MFRNQSKREKIKTIVILAVIVVFLFLGIFAGVIFPGSGFADVIENSIGKFFDLVTFFTNHYVTIIESIAIIIFVWIIHFLLKLIIRLLSRKGQRSETIGNIISSVLNYTAITIAVFLILAAWGVQTTTLLAGAGIVGLALSFGAQSLIEDVIAGLFIIFEKQYQIGDIIEIDGFRGAVVEIGIRVTKTENLYGDIKIFNNSDVRGAINTSAHLSPAICDISISYSEDLKRVEKIIHDNLPEIRKRIPDIAEGPFYKGVQTLGDSSVVIRIFAQSEELKKYQVTRDLNREMKLLFDQHNINIPFPQLVVHQEPETPKHE